LWFFIFLFKNSIWISEKLFINFFADFLLGFCLKHYKFFFFAYDFDMFSLLRILIVHVEIKFAIIAESTHDLILDAFPSINSYVDLLLGKSFVWAISNHHGVLLQKVSIVLLP
jgi:hypothetical protein